MSGAAAGAAEWTVSSVEHIDLESSARLALALSGIGTGLDPVRSCSFEKLARNPMKSRLALALACLAAVAACRGTGNDAYNNEGVSALSANNSSFKGGAAPANVGDAVTNTGTGVTGANGMATVTPQGRANSGSGKSGGSANSSGPTPAAPGAR